MTTSIHRRALALLVPLAATALVLAAPVRAVDTAKPTPCAGMLETDAAGDQSFDSNGFIGAPGGQKKKSADNTDVTGLFFNYRPGPDGKKLLTANIQISKLDKTVPPPSDSQGGTNYYVIWNGDGKVRFVRASLTNAGITYAYGTIDPMTGTYTDDGTTKGNFFEGADGIVQMDVPEDAGGKDGAQLGAAMVSIDYIQGGPNDEAGFNNSVDKMPDDATSTSPGGESYTVADCPAAGAPAAPAPAPAPAPQQSAGETAPASSQPAALPFRAAIFLGSAKKAKKAKALKFRVQATKKITNLKVQLKAANGKGKVLGTASAKSISGLKTLKMKLKKRIKKGRYALLATGTVDGKKLSVAQQVGVKA